MQSETKLPNYSSIGRRWVALLIDCLVLVIPGAIAHSLMPVAGAIVIWLLYWPFLESSEAQATVGKRVMGIQVCSLNGNRISLRAGFLRALLKLVSGMLLCLGYLVAFFTSKRQTLHDLVAETIVVQGQNSVPIADAWLDSARNAFQSTRTSLTPSDSLSRLERLQALRERGAISEEEFQAEKARILGTKPDS